MSSEPAESASMFASEEQLQRITERLAGREYAAALAEIEKIPLAARPPLLLSAQALCIAELKGAFKTSAKLCHDAIKREPKNPEHYFRQGQILLLANRKKDAIWVLRMGLRHGRHKGIIDTLGALGIRRPPPINFLPRSNLLNRVLGRLLTRLNLR